MPVAASLLTRQLARANLEIGSNGHRLSDHFIVFCY